MDPVSIIGIGGFVITLIDALGKTIESLNGMHGRWQDAELSLLSLSIQLGALKAALTGIQSWLVSDSVGMHYLLQMELDSSATCCQLLIKKVDAFIREVQRDDIAGGSGHLSFMGRAKMALSGSSIEDVLRMIDRQTNSMNLLLTACNCNTLASQKSFLGTSNARNTLKQAKRDTASLYVLRDADSLLSRSFSRLTGVSSKLSMTFEFDNELFRTRVYDVAHRASIKGAIRRREHSLAESQNSRKTVRILKDHKKDIIKKVDLKLWGDHKQTELFQQTLTRASFKFGKLAPRGRPLDRLATAESMWEGSTTLSVGPLTYHFSTVEMDEPLHRYSVSNDIFIIIVDLRSYARYDEHRGNRLRQLILQLETMLGSSGLRAKAFCIFLSNFKDFENDLAESPFSQHWPGWYSGSNENHEVLEFIKQVFTQVFEAETVATQRHVYYCLDDLKEPATLLRNLVEMISSFNWKASSPQGA
ncbi:hypothetical protein GGR55DRAFT_74012 [Xylaria sp. FL0064]|nr:hypothetical protein GGR55DRAFT_74012 [Xylaria sp. FL0064]